MTAKELWSKHFDGLHWDDITPEKEQEYAIEFAKYHVEQALKAASENVEAYVVGGLVAEVDKDSILNAYPLENIK